MASEGDPARGGGRHAAGTAVMPLGVPGGPAGGPARGTVPPHRHGYGQEGVVMPRVRRSPDVSAPGALTRLAFAGRGAAVAEPAQGEMADPARRLARGDGARAARIARLAVFVRHLVASGVLDDEGSIHTFIGGHRLQKCVYIAQRLGMRTGYAFDFMRIGAFSADLAVDICALGRESPGPAAPGARLDVPEALAGLVRGRDPEWLQVATFAARDGGTVQRGRFVESMRRLEYDAHTARDALGAVSRMAGAWEGGGDGPA